MKKLVFLSIGILAFALQPAANAQTSLFTTYEDWQGWQSQGAQWGNPAPVADNAWSSDASTINGLGNPTAPGGAGTSGSLIIGPGNGTGGGNNLWTCVAYSPGLGTQLGDYGDNMLDTGTLLIDYSLPDNEGGSYFQIGVLMQYQGNGYFGTAFSSSTTDLGFADPNGEEVYQAQIPYTISGTYYGMGFGLMINTDYGSVLPSHVDNILVENVTSAVVPEPGTIALMSLGLAGLTIIRRRQS
ncbi:MAG TPA: PEP-CTERM sorting domain-containing protein [Verrucomicrobiae bacterium]|nr:PEP-CTERM sorting domain-containing protein [Verrucomicrobiae bacterium]